MLLPCKTIPYGSIGTPMSNPILPILVTEKRDSICREVLESLPEWFGIPSAVDNYVASADELPMFAYFNDACEPIGFASVKIQTAFAAEVHVIGVKRAWHRRGIGRALVEAVVGFAISQSLRFLTVKTLSPSHSDANYARTRLFYEAVGFVPVEELPTLWGLEIPCLLMLRSL